MSNLAAFDEKFSVSSLTIFSSPYWAWSLRPTQPTLGASVVSLRRDAGRLVEILPDESVDLIRVLGLAQDRLMERFGCKKVNVLMLMHFDAHLHFHVMPRYQAEVTMFETVWKDPGWPGFPVGMSPGESAVPEDVPRRIVDQLK